MSPPFVPIGGGLGIDTRPQIQLVRKTRKSPAGLISTWCDKRKDTGKIMKKICLELTPKLHAELLRFKHERGYSSVNSLIVRSIEHYLYVESRRGRWL